MGRKTKQVSDKDLIIAYRIREARTKKYRTVTEAAELFPVDRGLWGNWEAARIRPQQRTIEKLASFLGVPAGRFSEEPENWKTEKALFLDRLTDRSKTRQDYYELFDTPQPQSQESQKAADPADDPLAVFLQITQLISDAKGNVTNGKISQETYDTHMRMISEMAKISLFGRT